MDRRGHVGIDKFLWGASLNQDPSLEDGSPGETHYNVAAIKDKAIFAIAQIKAQSWPKAMQATIEPQVQLMEEALKDLEIATKKEDMQQQFTRAFAKVLGTIEQGIASMNPQMIDTPDLEESLLRQSNYHYQEVVEYARRVSGICVAKADPAIAIEHMVHIANSSTSPDRRDLALRSIALQMTYNWHYQNASLSAQWNSGDAYNKTLTPTDRSTIEGLCAQYKKALQTPKGRNSMMSAATALVEQTANNQSWIRHRVMYLQGKSPRPGDYSLGAMFEYLAFLIDKFCSPSKEHKAILFSQAMRDTRQYTRQWDVSENSESGGRASLDSPQTVSGLKKNKGNS